MKLMGASIFEGPSSRNTRPSSPALVDVQDEEEQQQLQAKLQQMERAVDERGAQANTLSSIHTTSAAHYLSSSHKTLTALSQHSHSTSKQLRTFLCTPQFSVMAMSGSVRV